MADDKSKTKAQLIAELEGLRGELSEARQQVTPRDDASVLKIQLAVERVRAEAMAMRSSDDLLKVLRAMWREMDHLGFERMTTRIGFVDESEGRVRSFLAMDNPTRRGVSWTSSEIRELDDDLVIRIFDRTTSEASDVVDRWRKRDVWTFIHCQIEG